LLVNLPDAVHQRSEIQAGRLFRFFNADVILAGMAHSSALLVS
jgi:hypothetical protein